MIEKSENITNLAAALLKAQKEMGTALKDSKNPYFKSSYADLKAVIEAIKEPLNNNGIRFLQAVNGAGEGMPVVETMLLHESGQFLCTRTPVFCAKPNDPQAFGSGVTYSKRYALQAFLGLPTEDDDGNKGSNKDSKTPNQKPDKSPVPKAKSNEIVDLAFLQFEAENQAVLKEPDFLHFEFNKQSFEKAIIKHFKKLPTNQASIKKILTTVKPEEVLTEIPQEAA